MSTRPRSEVPLPSSSKPQEVLKDRYILKKTIGRGGMGSIFLADDNRLEGRLCALKVVQQDPNLSDELKQQGLDQNTLIVFLADQGFAGGHGGFWGMGDHTRPLTARDQCMHIPLIVHQPGKIKAGVKSDHHVANYDVYPSLLNHLGLADKIPRSPERPGRNFAPVLRGEHVEWDDSVFYEFENIRVIRTKDWKYVERIGDERHELYDLQNDPGESKNLIDDAAQHDMRQQLRARLAAFYKRYSDPKWDLWNGGDAKGGLLLGKEPYVKK